MSEPDVPLWHPAQGQKQGCHRGIVTIGLEVRGRPRGSPSLDARGPDKRNKGYGKHLKSRRARGVHDDIHVLNGVPLWSGAPRLGVSVNGDFQFST